MVCPNCGKVITDGTKFCTICGTSIAQETAATTPPLPAAANNSVQQRSVQQQAHVEAPEKVFFVMTGIASICIALALMGASTTFAALSGGKLLLLETVNVLIALFAAIFAVMNCVSAFSGKRVYNIMTGEKGIFSFGSFIFRQFLFPVLVLGCYITYELIPRDSFAKDVMGFLDIYSRTLPVALSLAIVSLFLLVCAHSMKKKYKK